MEHPWLETTHHTKTKEPHIEIPVLKYKNPNKCQVELCLVLP